MRVMWVCWNKLAAGPSSQRMRHEHGPIWERLQACQLSQGGRVLLAPFALSTLPYPYPGPGLQYYFECLLLGLEWHRAAHTFRLYFEARGEADLRRPGESSLGLLVHRAPPPDRRALEQRLRVLEQRWGAASGSSLPIWLLPRACGRCRGGACCHLPRSPACCHLPLLVIGWLPPCAGGSSCRRSLRRQKRLTRRARLRGCTTSCCAPQRSSGRQRLSLGSSWS